MENHIEKPHKKGMVTLVIAMMVLLIAGLGMGTLYYFEMTRANTLQRQVEELETAATEMDEQMAHDAHRVATVQYREIPELGVKYKVTEETEGLTYSYSSGENGEMRRAQFSTVELMDMQSSDMTHPCSQGFSGTIVRHDEEKSAQLNVRPGTKIKAIGDGYFFYTPPQNTCGIGGEGAPGLIESYESVQKAFDLLEAI